jgi:hypothetical protein
MDLVVALGGTGQLVLHYLLQWYLLGLEADKGPLRALVIDQDQSLASLRFAQAFFARLSDPKGLLATGEPAPWIREARLDVGDGHTRLEALLAGDAPHALHPARALFDRATLAQEVGEGLYGRPCLAPLLFPRHGESIRQALDAACQEGAGSAAPIRVVLVGSVVGGAGGGLLLPVLSHLLSRRAEIQLSAVLLERWFHAPTLSADLGRRQTDNRTGVLRTLVEQMQAESRFLLQHLVVLSGSEPRSEEQEKKAVSLPWPQVSHPIAEACFAVHHILRERVADNPVRVTDTPLPRAAAAATWSAARDAQRRASAAIASLLADGVVERMAADPLAERVFGTALPSTLAQFWEAYAGQRPAEYRAFPRLVTAALRKWYSGAPYALRSLFPASDGGHGRPTLRRLAAGLPRTLRDAGPPPSMPERAAVHILYHLLQGAHG